jgi:hypothetical protein
MRRHILRLVVIICAAAKLIDICFVLQEEANCVGESPACSVQQWGHVAAVMLVSYMTNKKQQQRNKTEFATTLPKMCCGQLVLLRIDSVNLCFALKQKLRNGDAGSRFVQRRAFVDKKRALFFNPGIYICFGGDKKPADVKMRIPASKMQRGPRTIPIALNDKN